MGGRVAFGGYAMYAVGVRMPGGGGDDAGRFDRVFL